MKIKSTIIKSVLLRAGMFAGILSLGLTPSLAQESTDGEPQPWTGDVYRISPEELDENIAFLDSVGGKILFSRDDLYLIILPQSAFDQPQALNNGPRGVKRKYPNLKPLKTPKLKAVTTMEAARFAKDANFIYEGIGLPGSFDGSGVVVGFSDVGFDACHSNFLTMDGSESRVRRFVHYELGEGRIDRLETPEEISAYRTDYAPQTHATHVAGILAGRGADGKYMGMAPGADIVATTSDLYDVVILAGIEEVIAYAKSVGKPAVINISIGSYGGPHDGTSLFCQYLDKCAEDAIICISTGNEGNTSNHIGHTFTSADDKIEFRWSDKQWAYLDVKGYTEMYSEDDSPLKVGLYLTRHNSNADRPYKGPMVDLAEDPEWVLTSDPALAEADPRFHYDETYAKYFDGEVYIQGGIDPNNGRFYARISYDTETEEYASPTQPWGKYQFGGYVQGVAGKRVDMFGDGSRSSFISNQGKPRPDSDMSISDLATGKNVISVGAYWARESLEMMNGNKWYGGTPMTICDFTSYGTLIDGRVTPMTNAPGSPIASSYSGPNVALSSPDYCVYEFDGHYWGPDGGTSMSTPYVAGVIATWLQAHPTMTSKEAQELIIKTNDTENYPLEANPRHGLGVFEPYIGLKELVARGYTDVETVLAQSVFAKYSGGVLHINNPDARDLRIDVYSVDGSRISGLTPGNPEVLTLRREELCPSVDSGIALCRISAPGTSAQLLKITL
ncbi:MAG: S8 family serine peptidase [Muribaculaceae bacterium]|nr:S8 family serine peptidase [Muribaculaceae bacterium]